MSEDKAQYNPADKMMSLKGKAYLPVAERIVWFRNDYPEGTIETTIVEISDQRAVFHARVQTGNGGQAEATGTETPRDFGDYIEKAETKAVGRALGYLGYGTAAAGFEEGARAVDAPQERRPAPRQEPRPRHQSAPPVEATPEAVTTVRGVLAQNQDRETPEGALAWLAEATNRADQHEAHRRCRAFAEQGILSKADVAKAFNESADRLRQPA